MFSQKLYEQILQDQKEHRKCKEEAQDMTLQFKERTEKLKQDVEEEERSYKSQIQTEKVSFHILSRGRG